MFERIVAMPMPAATNAGSIEGIEGEQGRLLGLQFHPESMQGAIWKKVFVDFISRSKI